MDEFSVDSVVKHRVFDKIDKKIISCILSIVVFFLLFNFLFLNAPKNFPEGIIFHIEQGSSLRSVSLELKEQNLIRSRMLFEFFVIMYSGDKHIIATDYLFEDKISSAEMARRISKGEMHLAPVKVTIPEGFTISDIVNVFSSKLFYFNKDKFLIYAKDKEGYLFPDTYFFFTTANEEDVFKSLSDNFRKKISILEQDIVGTGKSEEDIIKMASLIERESKGDIDRNIISGILWKRLSVGMPLQADAAPETYKNKGLPQKPIGNPGLPSIRAAIYPQKSVYWYYLHDKGGNIHYAKSFSEHRRNIEKYLK